MKKPQRTPRASMLMAAATSGIVASAHAAVVYDEGVSGDLANTSGAATVLTSGTDTVTGSLHEHLDRDDHFILGSLAPGEAAVFDWSFSMPDFDLQVGFTFSDPAGGTLHSTGFLYGTSGNGSTPALTVPASGKILVSVQNNYFTETGWPGTDWNVSTTDVVPEPSTSALVALGSLLALRRRKD